MKYLLFISLACLPLLVAVAEPPAAPKKSPAPLSLIVELTDGSRLMGTAEMETLPFIAKYGRMDLVMKEVAAVTLGEDRETVKVVMKNGDGLQGVLDMGALKLRTLVGDVHVPIRHVVRITAGGGWLPPNLFGPPGKFFEVPLQPKDKHGNPIREGKDEATGLPLEIRHKPTGMHFVFIPAGEFMMGSPEHEKHRTRHEGPVHKVTLTEPFYLGKYEVTVAEFRQLVKETGYKPVIGRDRVAHGWDGNKYGPRPGITWENPGFDSGEDHPVGHVSWDDCQQLLKRLTRGTALGRSEGNGLRFALPTEAQWEYACRAGTRTPFFWGDDESAAGRFANVRDRTLQDKAPKVASAPTLSSPPFRTDDGAVFAAPVGRYRPNSWGLYDMIGNMYEWCADWWEDGYAPGDALDPTGPGTGTRGRVGRGGCWAYGPDRCRSAHRDCLTPHYGSMGIGMRLCVRFHP